MFSDYIQKRIEIFERVKSEQKIGKKEKISISTEFGDQDGLSYETTPFIISKVVNPKHKEMIVARVNGVLWDAHRVLEEDSKVEFLTFEDPDGKKVFWHSSAHVLGEASENVYECHLCLGPPTDQGFFYEMSMDRTVVPEDYFTLQKQTKSIMKDCQKFERLELTKDQLLEMFSCNPLKVELIKDKVQEKSTVYRCGPLIDFCLGPHIPHTGYIKALEIINHSSSFFLGDSSREVLQRIYGISFPCKNQMKEYLLQLEEAKKNNHRKIGVDLDLFFFSPYSPGSCFFLPKGAFIYNTLVSLMKEKYKSRGFKEVVTPNVFTNDLWKTSGHWENYKDDMFCFDADNTQMALKPMNCPGHCILFKQLSCSYKDLPLRLADFGVLHRNEISGALTGLTRVRRFQQDDAHIFVQPSKVSEEIVRALDFLKEIYSLLGFTYTVALSTRPTNFLGKISEWDSAEQQLKEALDTAGCEWTLNEGDGAFYGPKIDISIGDAMGRKHQCGTIQLDFQMPQRFDLKYTSPQGTPEKPVMIHRAILGSVERMTGILLEHFKGKLPPWLNPNQVIIIPLTPNEIPYAEKIASKLSHLEVKVDECDLTINKRILNAEMKYKYSYILVVGPKDVLANQVAIRKLTDKPNTILPLSDAIYMISKAIENRVSSSSESLKYLPSKSSSHPITHSFNIALQCIESLFSKLKMTTVSTLMNVKDTINNVSTKSLFSSQSADTTKSINNTDVSPSEPIQ
ncbi:threonyl-tRNA synthetase [Nematocida sp. AWRm80]|nr:threonyl-tRNA synthetase [Nematocida sp. AWRm80]